MRGLERGELTADDPGLTQHLDACLGCRGCEPVCPSGVQYGRGLEAARELLIERRGLPLTARAVLTLFRHATLWRPLFAGTRLLRASSIAARLAGGGRVGFGMGMVAATGPSRRMGSGAARQRSRGPATHSMSGSPAHGSIGPETRPSVALFRGCVMDGLFGHVHAATRRTLEANGYRVIEPPGQVCCGALHEHAGDRHAAAALARKNLTAFAGAADYIVNNSAGCGALLKDYAHLLDGPAAAVFAGKVKDVSELLAARGPRPGGRLEFDLAYDAPCHLQHAQRVHEAPLAVLRAVPGLKVRLLPGSERCCGSAGIFSLLQPAMSRAVLDDKLAGFREADPAIDLVATGNPGCLMQIGAGLRAAGLPIGVAHPVEVLDWSYEAGGVYDSKE